MPVCLRVHALIGVNKYTRIITQKIHINDIYYRIYCIENEACSVYNSFTGTLKIIQLHYTLRSIIICGIFLVMLNYFKHIKIDVNQ